MKKNTPSPNLLPKSHTACSFLRYFSHAFNFIEAKNPYLDAKTDQSQESCGKPNKVATDWRTEKSYSIRPRVLWQKHQDPNSLIGLSFDTKTYFVALDIDPGSPYHPNHDEAAFRKILGTLEDIGLVGSIKLRSSWSEGLHVYFFFEEQVRTFDGACAVQEILRTSGFEIKSGKLEIFPNAKGYNSHYKGLRLPLQPATGSVVLDGNLNPVSDDVDYFLDLAEYSAKRQDIELFRKASKKYGQQVTVSRCSRGGKNSLEKFRKDLLVELADGFTADGQTNLLLLTLGCYGVVFEGLDETIGEESLTEFIVNRITNMKGYEEFCDHKHEIEKRAREVARSSQRFYWKAGTKRKRDRSFKDNFGEILTSVSNHNQEKTANTIQRLQWVLEQLKNQAIAIPATARELLALIRDYSKEQFGKALSMSTLYKASYKALWQPLLLATVTTASISPAQPVEAVTEAINTSSENPPEIINLEPQQSELKIDPKNAEPQTKPECFAPCTKANKLEMLNPAENKDVSHLDSYEGFGANNPDICQSTMGNPEEQVLAERQKEPKQKKEIAKTESKNKKESATISFTYRQSGSRNSIFDNKQNLLKQPSKRSLSESAKAYDAELRKRHPELAMSEEEEQLSKDLFAAVFEKLGVSREDLPPGTPSAPT